MRTFFRLLLITLALSFSSLIAQAAVPIATSFSVTASTVGSTQLQLQGLDPDGTALAFAIVSPPNPLHGSLSSLSPTNGFIVFTPATGFVGVTTFTFNLTSGAQTSTTATCTVTVTNAKTRIIDTLIDPSGTPRRGIVTFALVRKSQSTGGLIPAGATASAVLNSVGQFDISIFPSSALTPYSVYQVLFKDSGGVLEERIGVYNFPALTTTTTLAPHQVIDTNLGAQYTIASQASVNAMISGGVSGSPTYSGLVTMNAGAQMPGGQRLNWEAGGESAPSVSDATVGSRLILWPGPAPNHFAIGVGPGTMWFNVGAGNFFDHHFGATAVERSRQSPSELKFDSASALYTINFQSSSGSPGGLRFKTNGSFMQFENGSGLQFEFGAGSLRPTTDNVTPLGDVTHRWQQIVLGSTLGVALTNNSGGQCRMIAGTGSPEGAVTAPPCTIYLRFDGVSGTNTFLYIKQDNANDSDGWVAK